MNLLDKKNNISNNNNNNNRNTRQGSIFRKKTENTRALISQPPDHHHHHHSDHLIIISPSSKHCTIANPLLMDHYAPGGSNPTSKKQSTAPSLVSSPSSSPSGAHIATQSRRLSDDDVRSIFECLHGQGPLPNHLPFTIVPVGSSGQRLSPPSYEFKADGLYVLLRPEKKGKQGQRRDPHQAPKAPPHLEHLMVRDTPPETCPWSLSGPQFPQPTAIQQRYCYPKGSPEYSSSIGGALWTMYGANGKEDYEFRLLHVYYSAKRAVNKGVTVPSSISTSPNKMELSPPVKARKRTTTQSPRQNLEGSPDMTGNTSPTRSSPSSGHSSTILGAPFNISNHSFASSFLHHHHHHNHHPWTIQQQQEQQHYPTSNGPPTVVVPPTDAESCDYVITPPGNDLDSPFRRFHPVENSYAMHLVNSTPSSTPERTPKQRKQLQQHQEPIDEEHSTSPELESPPKMPYPSDQEEEVSLLRLSPFTKRNETVLDGVHCEEEEEAYSKSLESFDLDESLNNIDLYWNDPFLNIMLKTLNSQDGAILKDDSSSLASNQSKNNSSKSNSSLKSQLESLQHMIQELILEAPSKEQETLLGMVADWARALSSSNNAVVVAAAVSMPPPSREEAVESHATSEPTEMME